MRYTLTSNMESTLTVYLNGKTHVITSENSNFDAAVRAVLSNNESEFLRIADLINSVKDKFDEITDRVTVKSNTLYLDDEPINNVLADTILDFYTRGLSYLPLVRFLERLSSNPSMRSREQLYTWINDRHLTITTDGHFIAYKGVRKIDNGFCSINSGTAYVNGEKRTGQIPQTIGDIVTMPRPKVNDDSNIGCSLGLHAGTWDYASNFGRGYVLTVEIDPADVVSVPEDCEFQKLRVCKYRVTGIAETPYEESLVDAYEDEEDELYDWSEDNWEEDRSY